MSSPVLFLAWQSATTRRWYTVGRLSRGPEGLFEFVYTRGFLAARSEAGMSPLAGMDDPALGYRSEALFPHFQNRIMSPSREEFALYLSRLGLTDAGDPLVVLARSGGRRETDAFHLFPAPQERVGPSGERLLCLQFFTNGFRYMPGGAVGNAAEKPLCLMWDFQNPADDRAVMIRSEDNHNLGWVPRYYSPILLRLREQGVPIRVVVERLNPPGSPPWYRVLTTVTAPWPERFEPLEGDEYQPLAW